MYLKKFLMTIAAALCMLQLSAINPQNSKMKELNVKKVSVANIPVESVPALMDEEKVAFQPVNTVNWAAFPYTPDVSTTSIKKKIIESTSEIIRAALQREAELDYNWPEDQKK